MSSNTQSFDIQYMEEFASKRHFVIFVTEDFKSKNHLQIDTIKCYNKEKDYQFHLFNLNKTEKCNQTVEFYRRHCLLAETMHSGVFGQDFVRSLNLENLTFVRCTFYDFG